MVDAFGARSGNACAGAWRLTGGSSTALAAQVREGSPADVLVSAGTEAVEQLRAAGLTVGDPLPLGSIRATLYTNVDHTAAVGLKDLPGLVSGGWKLGLCVESAPCGAMADKVLSNAAAVWGSGFDRVSLVATEAGSASDLVTKVAMGELDAALVYEYVCETPPGKEAAGVCHDIPDSVNGNTVNVRTPYVAVRLKKSESADSFMDFASSTGFREYLAEQMRVK